MRKPGLTTFVLLNSCAFILSLSACQSTTTVVAPKLAAEPNIPLVKTPAATNDGWEVTKVTDVGLRPSSIASLVEELPNREDIHVHSLLIVKNNKLVVDEYFEGTDQFKQKFPAKDDVLRPVYSVTKSITSTLIGIAIDKGFISDTNVKIIDLFPEYANLFDAPGKKAITLDHILTMSSGLSWDEGTYPYDDVRSDYRKMITAADSLEFLLSRPQISKPGERFTYNSGGSILLGEVIRRTTGLKANEFAKHHLFEPLGIDLFAWPEFSNGIVQAGGGLWMRSRDMAKIGQLFLQGGKWHGDQIVSSNWVAKATGASIFSSSTTTNYGYQWWRKNEHTIWNLFRVNRNTTDFYWAEGLGGQFILVVPTVELVVVMTGWNGYQGTDPLFALFARILASVETNHQ